MVAMPPRVPYMAHCVGCEYQFPVRARRQHSTDHAEAAPTPTRLHHSSWRRANGMTCRPTPPNFTSNTPPGTRAERKWSCGLTPRLSQWPQHLSLSSILRVSSIRCPSGAKVIPGQEWACFTPTPQKARLCHSRADSCHQRITKGVTPPMGSSAAHQCPPTGPPTQQRCSPAQCAAVRGFWSTVTAGPSPSRRSPPS